MPRIRYSDAVRDQAVRLVLESQKPLTQVAKKFGCSVSALQRWLKSHRPGVKDHQPKPKDHQANPQTPKPGVKKFQQAVADKSPPPATFIPVNLIDQKSTSIEIVTPDGFTLKLTDTHPQYIAELLRELLCCDPQQGILGSC